MSDLQLLFLVLACLYAWECACWLRRGSILFLTWLGRHWRIAHPGTLIGNLHGSFVAAPPLPPLGQIFSASQFPLSLSPEGVLAYVSTNVNQGWRPQQTGQFFRFDQIQTAAAKGKKVFVNGALLVKTGSPHFAQFIARRLQELAKTPAANRAQEIEKLFRDSLDTKAVERRWKDWQPHAHKIRWPANALFIWLLLLSPLVIWRFGLKLSWPGLLAGLLALTTTTALFFRRAHRVFYPEAEDDRFTHFLTILLSPITAIRANDILSRPLLENFHPLALAKVFSPEREFRELARNIWRDIRVPALPVCPLPDPAALETERESRRFLKNAMETFLKRKKINPDDLAQPPRPLDETCRAYCPRCHAQFATIESSCSDCGGMMLVAFSRELRA